MRDTPGAGSLRSLVQLAWLCLFSVPHGGAKVLEKTFEEWLRYRDECLRRMASEPYPAGLFCNRTFDMYACWPDGSPGTAVNVSCPFYLPWFEKVKHGLVSRRCGTDGQWVTVNGSQPWRDYSQCEDELEVTAEEVGRWLGPQGRPGQPGRGWTRSHPGSLALCSPAGRRPPAHGELQGALHRGVLAVTAHPHLRPARPHRLQEPALHQELHPRQPVRLLRAARHLGDGEGRAAGAALGRGAGAGGRLGGSAEPRGSAGVPRGAGADAVLHPGQPLLVPGGSCLPLQAAHRGRVLREELLQALPLPGLGVCCVTCRDPCGVRGALDGRKVPEGERRVLGAEREHGLLVDHPHPHPARLPGREQLPALGLFGLQQLRP
ncbi:uncharacterized protein LOC119707063 isoform X3 [Motacilla alba alba]|uniref:uncharacterized protein LOC119707063 isoform X3 n=1 Tax=Motacilla alba alba TaxID=1094192 RepID=UPI0018D58785|nr:uncharacterized protein LOC119707063 isoform X3 [Motacilla alba alba]